MNNKMFGPYSLRNLRPKSAKVAEDGFTATLLRNGHAVAQVDCGFDALEDDDREADDLVVEFLTQTEMDFFKTSVIQLGRGPETDTPRDERFLRDLAEHTYHCQRLAALCKHNTVFRTPTDPPGHWRQIRAPYRPALESAIRRRYQGTQLEFANHMGAGM